MSTSKTRGRKDYFTYRTRPDGLERAYYPPCAYTSWPEGDTTFSTRRRNFGERLPRKAKKWMRKTMGWGRYRSWRTNHATKGAPIAKSKLG